MLHHLMGHSSVEAHGVAVHLPSVRIPIVQHLGTLTHQRQWNCSSREDVSAMRKRLREELTVGVSRQTESGEEDLKVDCHPRMMEPFRIMRQGNKGN